MRAILSLLGLLSLCVGAAFAGLIDSQRSIDTHSKRAFELINRSIQRADEVTYRHTDISREDTNRMMKASRKDLGRAAKRSKKAIY